MDVVRPTSGQLVDHNTSSDVSDADSDLDELHQDIEKFNQSVQSFLATHHDRDVANMRNRPTRGRGPARGPRKAAEPRGDIKARLSRANQAFILRDFSLAMDLIFEVIRINAETHQAWAILSSIFREQGHHDRALMAMVYAAHLRPKDCDGWLKCADFALDAVGRGSDGDLTTAKLCYSAALRAEPTNEDARLGRALVSHRQGMVSHAISDYRIVLSRRPHDIYIIRRMAEACMDSKDIEIAVPDAIGAYQSLLQPSLGALPEGFEWCDVSIYAELFACTGQFRTAILELKSLARRLLQRHHESFWDNWQEDDREFDEDDTRRGQLPDYHRDQNNVEAFGLGLPIELRMRLAIYRLEEGNLSEAKIHLTYVDTALSTTTAATNFPSLVNDIADLLFERGAIVEAIPYYEILRRLPSGCSAAVLLQLGRCYMSMQNAASAEECFIAAIEVDREHIDARIELANIYETVREDEEAFILVSEALALQKSRELGQQDPDSTFPNAQPSMTSARSTHPHDKRQALPNRNQGGSRERASLPRYRPKKRLVDPEKRLREEQERAKRLSLQYISVQGLKKQIQSGHRGLMSRWMVETRELLDDFRSSRRFYAWDKYLKFLGIPSNIQVQQPSSEAPRTNLNEMADRLSKTMTTQILDTGDMGTSLSEFDNYHGISFENWLYLFLDYALTLAIAGHFDESYQVCESAKDCSIFVESEEYLFLIYIVWGACAVYAGDEETCVSVARLIMKDRCLSSDSYRMFALLCKLCQSLASWYGSGPTQKFVLRQIKLMDSVGAKISRDALPSNISTPSQEPQHALDVCLLMLYGHILFTSASYVYALHYFLRARSLDPNNPLIQLSTGLGYIHYGLKRQALNRQYLIMQGLSFILEYKSFFEVNTSDRLPEANYCIARAFQVLGIQHLALKHYDQVLNDNSSTSGHGHQDLASVVGYNSFLVSLLGEDKISAANIVKSRLVL